MAAEGRKEEDPVRWHDVFLCVGAVLLVICAIVLFGCGPSCKLQQQRCYEGVAQLCGTDSKWRDVMDCNKLRRLKHCGCKGTPTMCTCRRAP